MYLSRPYAQIVRLVQRMADQLPSNKLRVVFLINNYHEVRKFRELPVLRTFLVAKVNVTCRRPRAPLHQVTL